MNIQQRFNQYFLIAIFGIALLLVLTVTHQATADDYNLPPRGVSPESPPVAPPAPLLVKAVDGARQKLQTHFSQSWPWDKMHWQEVWTTVQWSDGKGGWFDVAGWQGNLDAIVQGEAGWVGEKEWWVAADDLGTGPFRWLVYEYPGGPLLAISEPFYLPAISGQVGIVSQELSP